MSKDKDLMMLAEADLKVSETLLNSFNDELIQNNAAYHTEQALEKLMKSLKEANGANATITHNITTLRKDLEELKIEVPEWVSDMDDEISSWATTIRYNANFKSDHDSIDKANKLIREWMDILLDKS